MAQNLDTRRLLRRYVRKVKSLDAVLQYSDSKKDLVVWKWSVSWSLRHCGS
jgi:hypothetical protein